MKLIYCPQCGHQLVTKEIGGQLRRACPVCDYVHWSNESLGAGGVVIKDQQVLLIQRAQAPNKGGWTIPGGFVEQNETIRQAVVREVEEETGIKTEPIGIIGMSETRYLEEHNLYLGCKLRYVGGNLQPQISEVQQVKFVNLTELDQLPVADLSRKLIKLALTTDGLAHFEAFTNWHQHHFYY